MDKTVKVYGIVDKSGKLANDYEEITSDKCYFFFKTKAGAQSNCNQHEKVIPITITLSGEFK